jgi:hypothetical protein
MSEGLNSRIDVVDIYVPLLNEGTTVIRPTKGLPLGEAKYRVLATADYSPEMEEWEFPPGTVVKCGLERWSGGDVLVARQRCGDMRHEA